MILNEKLIADVMTEVNTWGWTDAEYVESGPPDGRGVVLQIRGRNPLAPDSGLATWSVLVGHRGDVQLLVMLV